MKMLNGLNFNSYMNSCYIHREMEIVVLMPIWDQRAYVNLNALTMGMQKNNTTDSLNSVNRIQWFPNPLIILTALIPKALNFRTSLRTR